MAGRAPGCEPEREGGRLVRHHGHDALLPMEFHSGRAYPAVRAAQGESDGCEHILVCQRRLCHLLSGQRPRLGQGEGNGAVPNQRPVEGAVQVALVVVQECAAQG